MKKIMNKIRALSLMAIVILTAGFMTSCSQDDDGADTASVIRFLITDGGVTRAATDGTSMRTTFEQGDRAGLYAVIDGQVILNNIPLTFSVNGFWEADEPIAADKNLSNAKFYAYYPYCDDASFNAASNNPFAAMVEAIRPSANQSSKAHYEAADVMVTAASSLGTYNTVSLTLKHQKAMVCVELPNSSYIFNNAGIDPYVMAKSEDVAFYLNGNSVYPYFDEPSQSYCLIIEPEQDLMLDVTFTNNSEDAVFKADMLSQLKSGQYAKYVVDGGAQLINTTLQIGDYYCANGRIISKDTPQENLPQNIIGVVFKLGTTEALRSANSNWSHGVVVGLKEIRGKWGTNSSATSEQNTAGWRYWYRNYGLDDQGTTSAGSLVEETMAEEGYETTKAWRNVPEPLTIGNFTLDYTTEMNAIVNSWVDENPLPNGVCSGWYIPSLRDLQNLEAQSTLLSQQLTAIDATDLLWNTGSSDRYWSCNVRGAGSNWCYVGVKTTLTDRYKGVACNGNAYYRFLLAF